MVDGWQSVLLCLLPRSNRVWATDARLDRTVELINGDPLAEDSAPHRGIFGLGGSVGGGFALGELFCGGSLGEG